jgi:hypothetical protein
MENSKSFIKKIISVKEWQEVASDVYSLFIEDDESAHSFDIRHNIELITKSFSHESLLIWNTHVWAHFNGEKWDALFIGVIRKSEKYGKKFMDEYVWLSKNSNKGYKLYKIAEKYAAQQKCDFITMNVTNLHPKSEKIKNFYSKIGFTKDSETYIKKLIV